MWSWEKLMRNIWVHVEISVSSCSSHCHLGETSEISFRDLSGCFSALSLVNSWSSGCDEAVLFHLCLVKAVSLLNICWPVLRRRSCFRNVKRLFAEPVRRCIRQSLCLSLRQIATSLEDSCSVLKRSVLLYTPSASEIHREMEKTETRCLQRQKRYERKYSIVQWLWTV